MARRKNGQGSITKTKDGLYRMRKQVGVLSNGRPRILTVTATSETGCLKKMALKEQKVAQTAKVSGDELKKTNLTKLCYKHLEEHLTGRDPLKPKAADRRESTIRNQIEREAIGRLQVSSVKPIDIENHIEHLINDTTLSVSSITKTLDVINAAYNWAISKDYLDKNPCDPVMKKLRNTLNRLDEKASSDGMVIVLSDEQVKTLETYVENMQGKVEPHQYYLGLSVLFLLYTGMRCGELCALRWRDYSRSTRTVTIDKTRNISKDRNSMKGGYKPNENAVKNWHARTIVLDDKALSILERMFEVTQKKSPEDYILLNKVLKPTNPSNYGAVLSKLFDDIGLGEEVSGAHILRRSCATRMFQEGCRVEDIASYLGDTTETVMKHYISLTKKIVSGEQVLNVIGYPKRIY